MHTIVFALKGIAAYATHARQLGYIDPEVDGITQEALYFTLTNVNFNLDEHLQMAMKVGKAAIKVMELLDKAHTERFSIPQPVRVSQNKIEGKCIIVTGHNLFALEELLKQTEGLGTNVYTHLEMLPAHGYPGLKRYPHLKGNIGKAWYDQRRLFEEFPGAILATTNCVMPIKGSYADRFFSYDVAGLEGVTKIENDDFSPLIEKALSLPEANIDSAQTLLPEGTAIIDIDVNSRQFESIIFVGGQSYAKGITFRNLDTNDIIEWIENETGLCYEKQFQLWKEEERALHFQECIHGVAVSPSGTIEINFDEEGKLTLFSVNGHFPSKDKVIEEKFSLTLEDVEPLEGIERRSDVVGRSIMSYIHGNDQLTKGIQ